MIPGGLIPILYSRMKRSFLKVGPTFYGGNTNTPQSTTILFPYPECSNAYSITTNASEWKLAGSNVGQPPVILDTQTRQFGTATKYTFTNTTYFSNYTFTFTQTKASTSNILFVRNLSLTNDSNYTLHPILTSVSATYNAIPSQIGGTYRGKGVSEFFTISFLNDVYANSYTISSPYSMTWTIDGKSSATPSVWTRLGTGSGSSGPYTMLKLASNTFRVNVMSVTGSSNANISSFKLYDTYGSEITRPMITNPNVYSTSTLLPTNVVCQTYTSNLLGNSPFMYSSESRDPFRILFNTYTGISKIYIESTGSVSLKGNNISYQDGITTLTNGINNIHPRYMYLGYDFIPSIGVKVSNVLLISDIGPLNPYIYSGAAAPQSRYGGVGYSNIQVTFDALRNTNYYNIISKSPYNIVSYNVQAYNGTSWATIDTKSNLYSPTNFYNQQEYPSAQYSSFIFNIFETGSGFSTDSQKAFVSNVTVCNNGRSIIPPMTSNSYILPTNFQDKTSLSGNFTVKTSPNPDTCVLNLFDLDTTTHYRSRQTTSPSTTTGPTGSLSGEWFQVDFPSNISVSYYTLMTSANVIRAPDTWYILGSGDTGSTFTNVLSTVTNSGNVPSPYQSNTYYVSNTQGFSSFRFVCTNICRDACFELTEFAMYDTNGRLIPKFIPDGTTLSSYTIGNGTQLYGGIYRGTASLNGNFGEYVALQFPTQVKPYYVRITSNANSLPSNILVYGGSTIIGSYNYYIPTNQVVIPLVPTLATTFYVQACEMVGTTNQLENMFMVTEIEFLDLYRNVMNSPMSSNTQVVTSRVNVGGYGSEFVTITTPTNTNASYYSFKCNNAVSWNIIASTDNSTFTQLDSRSLDSVNTDVYMYYFQNSSQYKYYRLNIQNTIGTSTAQITNFTVYDSKRSRLVKFKSNDTTFVDTWSGGVYDIVKGKNISDYYGEWVTFQYPYNVRVDNVTISIDQTSSLLGFTVLGKNTELEWRPISIQNSSPFGVPERCNVYDYRITGTFTFSGSSDVLTPSSAFVMDSPCLMTRKLSAAGVYTGSDVTSDYVAPYVQIELPVPTRVTTCNIYMPLTDLVDPFGTLVDFRIYASNTTSSWTNIYRTSGGLQSTTVQIASPGAYSFYRLCIQKVNSQSSIKIKGFELLNVYDKTRFTPGRNIQQLNTGTYAGNVIANFTQPVNYSNLAIVVYKYTNDPYVNNGRLKINSVKFSPITFYKPPVGSNVYYQYSNVYTDVVDATNGVDQYVQISSSENIEFVPGQYSFSSNTANVWSLYGSSDGANWDVLDDHARGSTRNRTITTSNTYSNYRLNIHSITHFVDATTDVSNISITSQVRTQFIPDLFSSNVQTMDVYPNIDSYANVNAVLVLTNGF